MSRSWFLWALVALVVVPSASAAEVDDPDVLAEAAITAHPGMQALRSNVDSLRAAADASRLWMDPMLGAELSNLPVTRPLLDSHALAGIQFKLQQTFPAPGEVAARASLADARTGVAKAAVEVAANALRGEVRSRYWDLHLVRRLRAVTVEHVERVSALITAVEARYRVGAASQHDLLHIALRRDRLAEDLEDFNAAEAALLAALNGALARPPETPVGTLHGALPVLQGMPEDRVLRLGRHPDVRSFHAKRDLARAEALRARAEAAPEPTVWLGYRVRAVTASDVGTNFFTAGVSLPLPFASTRRWRADRLAADARARSASEAAAGKLERLKARLAGLEARLARAAERARTFAKTLEPAARVALESTLSAYRVDRAGFSDLIRADIALLDIERRRLGAETEAASHHAAIVTLLAVVPEGAAP